MRQVVADELHCQILHESYSLCDWWPKNRLSYYVTTLTLTEVSYCVTTLTLTEVSYYVTALTLTKVSYCVSKH